MPTDIKLKNSVTATNAPTSLQQGEVAINITDKKVWVGNAATTPVLLLGSGADGTFTNLTVSGVASFADGTVSLPSITNIGDTNTGIFFPAADTIAFTEGGVESMRIDSAGLVGIGTNSPNSRVTIGANATDAVLSGTTNTTGLNLYARAFGISQIDSVTSSSNNTGMSLRTYNNGTYTEFIANDQGNTTRFQTAGSEKMRITSAGNVGIGTSTPSFKLAVSGSDSTYIGVTSSSGGTGSGLYTANATNAYFIGAGAASGGSGLEFRDATNGVTRMVISSAGNLSVGAGASPTARLAVTTGSASSLLCAFSDGVAQTLQIGTETSGLYFNNSNSGYQAFQIGSTERMRIASGGEVFVGATSALVSNTTMSVQGSGRASAMALKGDNVGTPAGAYVWNATTTGNGVFFEFGTEASFTTRGSISYNRAAGLTVYSTTSDYRAKDIISPVLNSGELIDSVPVYMGKMKGATQARPMFIAHETPEYAHTGEKDAVDKDGNPVYQQMDASSLVPVLWAEIQSLRLRIAALESK